MIDSGDAGGPTPRSRTGSASAAAGTRGYIQTWLVHMRHPMAAARGDRDARVPQVQPDHAHGVRAVAEPDLLGPDDAVFTQAGFIEQLFPGSSSTSPAHCSSSCNFIFVYLNVAGPQRGSSPDPDGTGISPLYRGLMSWAAWKGFIQLFTNPFYWEKTTHGLDDGSAVRVASTVSVVHRERPAGSSNWSVVAQRRPKRRWESVLVFAFFTVGLLKLVRLLGRRGPTWSGSGRSTASTAPLMVWHNDPPVVRDRLRLTRRSPTLLITPWRSPRFVTSMAAVPVASAIFAAITMVAFNTMMRRPGRWSAALRPAARPRLQTAGLLYHHRHPALRVDRLRHPALGSLFAWYITADVRWVLLAGISYSSPPWPAAVADAVRAGARSWSAPSWPGSAPTASRWRHRRRVHAPTVYVVALWTVFNFILLGTRSRGSPTAVTRLRPAGLEMFSAVDLMKAAGELVLYGARWRSSSCRC